MSGDWQDAVEATADALEPYWRYKVMEWSRQGEPANTDFLTILGTIADHQRELMQDAAAEIYRRETGEYPAPDTRNPDNPESPDLSEGAIEKLRDRRDSLESLVADDGPTAPIARELLAILEEAEAAAADADADAAAADDDPTPDADGGVTRDAVVAGDDEADTDTGTAGATGLQSSLADADDPTHVSEADRKYHPLETDDHGIVTRMSRRDGRDRRTWTEATREVFRILCDLYDATGDPVMNEQIADHTDYTVGAFTSKLKDAGAVEQVGVDNRRVLLRPTEAGRKSLKDHADASTHLSEADREEGTFTPGTTHHEVLTIVAVAAHEGETPIRSHEVKHLVVDTNPGSVTPAMSTLYQWKSLDRERNSHENGGIAYEYDITDHGIDQLREHGLYEPEGDDDWVNCDAD